MLRVFIVALLGMCMSLGAMAAAKPEIVELSPDTYLVVMKNYSGIFGNQQTTKLKAIRAANSFATSRGKIAIPLSMEYTPAGGGPGQWPAAEYQFRVVDQNDPEAQRTALVARADTTIDINQRGGPAREVVQPANKKDLYAELIKLDDLKTRGIISPAEFEELKRRALDSD